MHATVRPLRIAISCGLSLLSSGWLWGVGSSSAMAQTPGATCVPNATGDGWICQGGVPAAASSTPVATGTRSTAGSPHAVTQDPAVTALDWVPREAMTPAQRAALDPACCGAFIEPDRPGVDPTQDPAQADTQLESAVNLTQTADGAISVQGDVRIQQGNRTLRNTADTVFDRSAETVTLHGDVEFREPGILLRGDAAFIDRSADTATLEGARYVLYGYGIHGQADQIQYQSGDGTVTIDNGDFSRCEPGDPFWLLQARSLRLDQAGGRGYASGARLEVGGIPVFYFPFTLQFPLGDQRISGFLAPSTGTSRQGGFDLQLPYYVNLAPHYDLTLSPRLLTDRGVMAGVEFRYLSRWSMNTLNTAYLGNDRQFDPATAGNPASASPPTPNRWFVGFEHFGALGDRWSTFVDYSAVSDVDYFEDLGAGGLNVASRTHLNRQARLDFRGARIQGGLNLQRIQVIDPRLDPANAALDINTPYDRLPQTFLQAEWPLLGPLGVSLDGEYTRFDRRLNAAALDPALRAAGALVTGGRLNLEPAIWLDWSTPGAFLRPRATVKTVHYALENAALITGDDTSIQVPVYSLDSGLVFERQRPGGGLQTLEPRLYYLNSGFAEQDHLPLFDGAEFSFSFNQLFRDDRFTGGDRIGDSEHLALAVTTRVLDDRGREQARFGLGQIHYFADRRVTLLSPLQAWLPRYGITSSQSALLAEAQVTVRDGWRLHTDAQWDEDRGDIIEGTLQLRHQDPGGRILNLGYRYRDVATLPGFLLPVGIDPRIEQSDVSGIIPVNASWRLLGRWNYDLVNARPLESFAGIEFSNCCATVRLVAREWVREEELLVADAPPERGVFFQFTLHGLGNLAGGGLSGMLQDGIAGFRDRVDGNSGFR